MASLYESSIPVLSSILETEASLFKKAEEHAKEKGISMSELLETRLYEDMLPLHVQVMFVTSIIRKAIVQLTGKQISDAENKDRTLAECYALIDETLKLLADVKPETLSVKESDIVTIKIPSKDIPVAALGYVQEHVVPNAYFHLNMTYAILRMKGIPLGKLDYLRSFWKSIQV